MSTAQVALGITQTILALLGPSADGTAMLANIARRPFLAFLLAAGSPSVYFKYLLAITAVVNIVIMNWELGFKTVCIFWSHSVIGPSLWAVGAILTDLLSNVSLSLQMRRYPTDKPKPDFVSRVGPVDWFCGLLSRFRDLTRTEFEPASAQVRMGVNIGIFEEGKALIIAD
ncbi:hypothetical protein B0H63DRAFT_529415 [Podospora didyma]|uniref:Uncharacterized protein n=1 Tax=Podospora didyma TaxID=330526 RepID=A0AAE0N1X2_9PEZI|nr:hypothetical protein B0H63DRAFT_529415 [Podospora didyma]